MAHYVVTVRSPMPAAEAFAYMADLTNFEKWDPGVVSARQVQGEGPGPDAAFEVEVKSVGGSMTLVYRTTEYDAPTKVRAVAESSRLVSDDTIIVQPDGDGSLVTYDATLRLKGVLGLFDPVLGLTFKRIGDRAANGLVAALDGAKV
jgi:hypothetical protein